ncbi:putative ly-6/neurotoxin superfamily member 1 [Operophtera brumata]|uniref:Putative ly-6/neurotoxin superfamily member 1 n=1 Tax=Operophtera brumata TaxID=104452 RepID=A0A0L7L7W8_OPEBR|nr:putative ly-6/neurotoxin superfamily member 1 [Operophtera brumata]
MNLLTEGEPVRCWTCSSDLNPLCNDPFHAGNYDNSYAYRLENCDANTGATYPYLTSSKSACKKQKKYINGQQVISRGCTWKRQDDYTNTCPTSNNGVNEVTSFCETCEYDACNGAATIGKAMALIIAPLGLLLFK